MSLPSQDILDDIKELISTVTGFKVCILILLFITFGEALKGTILYQIAANVFLCVFCFIRYLKAFFGRKVTRILQFASVIACHM